MRSPTFIKAYHPEAKEIGISDDADVAAATEAVQKKNSQRIFTEVIPQLDSLSIKYNVTSNGKSVIFRLGEYSLALGGRTAGRYTLTIWSKTKTTEDAIVDFENAQELSANGSEDSNRKARIPMSELDAIVDSITKYVQRRGI